VPGDLRVLLTQLGTGFEHAERALRELERRTAPEPWSLLAHWRESRLRTRVAGTRNEYEAIRALLADLEGTLAYEDFLTNPPWTRWAQALARQLCSVLDDLEREHLARSRARAFLNRHRAP
jgi:hypothetical protein